MLLIGEFVNTSLYLSINQARQLHMYTLIDSSMKIMKNGPLTNQSL